MRDRMAVNDIVTGGSDPLGAKGVWFISLWPQFFSACREDKKIRE